MPKVRQDAWSHEDDLLLAETVLRHIREGSTQLNAFEEVGDQLNRTSAACGFRWNAEVRDKYHDAIEIAKRQRKERKRAAAGQAKQPVIEQQPQSNQSSNLPAEQSAIYAGDAKYEETHTIDTVIQFLKQLKEDYKASNQSLQSLEQIQEENEKLQNQVNELENELTKTSQKLENVQEDYQVFMQIMDKARKMAIFEEPNNPKTPSFRMDKNGNLEQVADNTSQ